MTSAHVCVGTTGVSDCHSLAVVTICSLSRLWHEGYKTKKTNHTKDWSILFILRMRSNGGEGLKVITSPLLRSFLVGFLLLVALPFFFWSTLNDWITWKLDTTTKKRTQYSWKKTLQLFSVYFWRLWYAGMVWKLKGTLQIAFLSSHIPWWLQLERPSEFSSVYYWRLCHANDMEAEGSSPDCLVV